MKEAAFGKYVLYRRLARGGMAELFLAGRASDGDRGEPIVIKLISPRFAKDAGFLAMFQDEARIAATLDHPNIGRVLDVGQAQDCHYLALEYIHGKDLRDIASRCLDLGAPVPIGVAVQIGAKTCAALHYAHEATGPDGAPLEIVHRDLSLSNIMVTFSGQVKLVDFGIAKAANRMSVTMPGMIKGKARYLSPEQVTGRNIDRRSDLFSLATSLWEALVGRHLFEQEQDIHIYEAVAKGWVRRPSEVVPDFPPQLEAILLKALSLSPDDRFASAKAMQQALELFAQSLKLPSTDSSLSRFMQHLFDEEMAAWQKASAQKKSLLTFLREMPAPERDKDATPCPVGPDQQDEEAQRDTLVEPPSSEAQPAPAPGGPANAQGAGPRRTVLYGELSAADLPPRPVTTGGPATPSGGPATTKSPAPPVHKKTLGPGVAAGILSSGNGAGQSTAASPTSAAPEAVAAEQVHRVGASQQVAITPDGAAAVITPGQADPASAGGPADQREDRRATILTEQADVAASLAKMVPDQQGLGPGEVVTNNELVLSQATASADPVIGQDRSDLEKKRAAAGEDQGASEDQEAKGNFPRKRPSTGDWAHQATSLGEKRAGTHPYFNLFKDAAFTVPPESGASAEPTEDQEGFDLYGKKKRMVVLGAVGIGLAALVAGGLWWAFSGETTSPEATAQTGAAAQAQPDPSSTPPPKAGAQGSASSTTQVLLTTDPPGATVFDGTDGQELGKTPLNLPLTARRLVNVSLAGHQTQEVTLDPTQEEKRVVMEKEGSAGTTEDQASASSAAGSGSTAKAKASARKRRNPRRPKKIKKNGDNDGLIDPFN